MKELNLSKESQELLKKCKQEYCSEIEKLPEFKYVPGTFSCKAANEAEAEFKKIWEKYINKVHEIIENDKDKSNK